MPNPIPNRMRNGVLYQRVFLLNLAETEKKRETEVRMKATRLMGRPIILRGKSDLNMISLLRGESFDIIQIVQ